MFLCFFHVLIWNIKNNRKFSKKFMFCGILWYHTVTYHIMVTLDCKAGNVSWQQCWQSTTVCISSFRVNYTIKLILRWWDWMWKCWKSLNLLLMKESWFIVDVYGVCGVMAIIIGNGHGNLSSNPWMKLFAFHIAQIPLSKVYIEQFSLQLWINSRVDWFFNVNVLFYLFPLKFNTLGTFLKFLQPFQKILKITLKCFFKKSLFPWLGQKLSNSLFYLLVGRLVGWFYHLAILFIFSDNNYLEIIIGSSNFSQYK